MLSVLHILFLSQNLISLFGTDDDEEEEEEMSADVKGEAQDPPSSPCSFSLLDPVAKEEKDEGEEEELQLLALSSDSEADTDSELTMGEE